jgi:hypothetical protein
VIKKIALHSAPRSGSTWLGQIFNSHPEVAYRFQPLFSYAFKDRLNECSRLPSINQFFWDLLDSQDKFLLQIDEGSLAKRKVVFEKSNNPTHVVYKEVRYHHILKNLLKQDPDIKVIGLVRNPMAVINSWQRSPREFRRDLGWDLMEEWRDANKKNLHRIEEFHGFTKWKAATKLFLRLKKEYPDNFYLITYNELLTDTVGHVSKVFAFCELDMADATMKFLADSRSQHDTDEYSVYKSHVVDSDWEKELDPRITKEIITELTGTEMEQFLK